MIDLLKKLLGFKQKKEQEKILTVDKVTICAWQYVNGKKYLIYQCNIREALLRAAYNASPHILVRGDVSLSLHVEE